MIEFLELRACSVRIKVATPLNGARAAIATLNNGTVHAVATSVGFKLAVRTYVRGDTGAGGLVAPLPRTACFGKLAILFGCALPQQA